MEIYRNENNLDDTRKANFYLSDETPLKIYRQMDANPFFNYFSIKEFDVINNTSKYILESDYYTFEKNKLELLPISVDL